MSEKSIQLNFEGYWREGTLAHIPARSGVFCVYECGPVDEEDRFDIKRLLFIGEAPDVQSAIANYDGWDDWNRVIDDGNHLCFSFAPVESSDRPRVHAALVYEFAPEMNEAFVAISGIGRPSPDEVRFFPFDRTTLQLSGRIDLLKENFTVERQDTD